MKNSIYKITFLSIMAALMSSCAKQISPNIYSAQNVGEASRTYSGIIVAVRSVEIHDKDQLEENTLGLIGGAVTGGVAGSFAGKGHGKTAATGLGAILGAVGGTLLEKEIKKQNGLEYVIRLADGSALTIVQGLENPLTIGQKVIVIVSNKGRSRVIADTVTLENFKNPSSQVNMNVKKL